MSGSQQQHESYAPRSDSKLAKTLAPEEIRVGDFVSKLYEVREYPALVWCYEEFGTSRDEMIRIPFTPDSGGEPLKVLSVCLPFVLVKHPCGQRYTLDVRLVKLARLERGFAKTAWKSLDGSARKRKKKRK